MERFMHPWRSDILLLLSWELELYAAVNHEGRAYQKFREKDMDPLGALADWNGEGAVCQRSWFGVGCADGRVMDLKAGNGIVRRLLQVDSEKKGWNRENDKNQQTPSPLSLLQQPGQSLSSLSSPSYPPGVSTSLVAIPSPIFLLPSPSYHVPRSQPSPSPSNFMTPGPSYSVASEDPTYIPLPSPSPIILPPSPSLSLPPLAISPSLVGGTYQGKHTSSQTIYMSIIGGISFLLGITILFTFCCRANKVVTITPLSTGLSGQLQKAFVTGVPALKRSEIVVACEDFSNIIGFLPDCRFYKGTLSSGVEIAVVSTLITSSKDWSKQSQFREKI